MFEQSLLEIAARGSRLKGWTVLASAGFQFLLVGILILLPLLHIEALPKGLRWVPLEPPPGPRQTEPPQPPPLTHHARQSEVLGNTVVAPSNIPDRVSLIEDPEPLPPPSGSAGNFPGPLQGGTGTTWARPSLFADAVPPPLPVSKFDPSLPVKVSQGVQNARAISQPSPIYPPLARQARIQGRVQLEAIINKIGAIESLRVVSGHPLLVQAALDAVKQWRYRPTLLNGEPVEVLTTIEVNFTLAQ